MALYNFMRELTANNFYQRNCNDLKPVPIIRFIFQFGFRIVWDSDPSGFGILKCPSLGDEPLQHCVQFDRAKDLDLRAPAPEMKALPFN